MGSEVNGIYVPDIGEVGWGNPVSENQRRLADIGVNVKAFGAVGDGVHDDTQNIRDAIAATQNTGGSVFFPPSSGNYRITSTIDLTTTGSLYLFGGGKPGGNTQFQNQPSVKIEAPSTVLPMFQVHSDGAGAGNYITFENLSLIGAACAVRIRDAALFRFNNCAFTVSSTADADNAALVFENTFWVWFEHCAIHAPTTADPAILLRGKTPKPNVDICFLFRWTDCVFSGGGVKYSQTTDYATGEPHSFVFNNVTAENFGSGMTLFEMKKEAGCTNFAYFRDVQVRNSELADAGGSNHPVLRVDSSGDGLQGALLEGILYWPRLVERVNGGVKYLRTHSTPDLSPVVETSGVTSVAEATIQTGRLFSAPLDIWGQHGGEQAKILFRNGGSNIVSLYASADDVLKTDDAFEMTEQASDPAAPATNNARLYVRDNGSGKTQLVVRFPTGAIQVLATEP